MLQVAHETVTAHHGNDYMPLAERFCRASRPALFGVLDVLVLRSASADTSLLDAIRFLRASRGRTGEYIPAHEDAASGMPRLMYRITCGSRAVTVNITASPSRGHTRRCTG